MMTMTMKERWNAVVAAAMEKVRSQAQAALGPNEIYQVGAFSWGIRRRPGHPCRAARRPADLLLLASLGRSKDMGRYYKRLVPGRF